MTLGKPRLRRAWMLFDWAAHPYFTLIATFIFPPFFVTQLVADPVYGQVVWGWTTAAAALATGLIAPLAGSVADRSPRSSAVFFLFCAMAVFGATGLWWSFPGRHYALQLAVGCIIFANVGFEVATSLNNSMLRFITTGREGAQLAWRGAALGGLSGILVLLIFVGLLAPGEGGVTILGISPLLDFEGEPGAIERFAGPFVATWFILFLLPLALVSKEFQRQPSRVSVPLNSQPKSIVVRHRPALRFLLANMLLADGLLALFAFGGIYAATVFGWDALRLGLFAIALTVSGFLGVALCIPLDRRLGTMRIAAWSSGLAIGTVGFILGLNPTSIFIWPARPVDAWLLTNTAEVAFALVGLLAAAASTSLQAALRSMYVVAAPREKAGLWFGYFALSGKTTAFVGPILVSAAIAATGSTKAGMGVVLGLLLVGAVVLRSSRAELSALDAQVVDA